ncbi:MAG: hypothetical protein J6K29_11765, partial [Clostridia bacterium]|nr:hypothetical protein [Clostridia bacterium]
MNTLRKKNGLRMVLPALLMLVSVLLLSGLMVLGAAAEETYSLRLDMNLYDEEGGTWPVSIQVPVAEGETIDPDALIAQYPHVSEMLAGSFLTDEGYVGMPEDGKMPAGNLTLTATYELRPYTVTWMVDGVAHEQPYAYDRMPVFTGSTDKAPDAQYTYTFKGWDGELLPVTEDVTYTAQYESTVNKYTVTWIVDGETAKTEELEYGTLPSFVPTKENTAEYTYTFSGWDKEITAVEGDVTYIGSFAAEKNKYTVTWVVDGETAKT